MQVKPEVRKSDRFSHESIIKYGDELTLSPYYAVSYNFSETGMHFRSLFELYPGTHILIDIDDYTSGQNQIPAKVVWCKKLEDTARFRYGVGVEFLKSEKNVGLKATLPITPQVRPLTKNKGGVVIKMEKRSTK